MRDVMSSLSHAVRSNGQGPQDSGPIPRDPESEPEQLLSSPPTQDNPRPAKRRRMTTTTTLRTAIACQTCRDRKTRCSGEQPTCKYCSRAGIACEYTSNTVTQPTIPLPSESFGEWGPRILDAIGDLAQNIQGEISSKKHYPRSRPGAHDDSDSDACADGHDLDYVSENLERCHRVNSPCVPDQPENRVCTIQLHGPTLITGSLSIPQWPLFRELGVSSRLNDIRSARVAVVRQRNSSQNALQSASCSVPELHALLACFERSMLPDFPVINISHTKRLISDTIADYSVPWSAEACLILLVSALGAISQPRSGHARLSPMNSSHLSSPANSKTSSVPKTSEGIMSAAMRYWTMAKKRLMWAVSTNGQLSAQCQLLAGVYLIYTGEPASAAKMLHGALLAINDLEEDIPDSQTGHDSASSLNQRILTVILVLICRLRDEIQQPLAPSTIQYYETNELCDHNDSQDESLLVPHRTIQDLLQIRAQACANAAHTNSQLPLKRLHALQQKVSATLKALDQWHAVILSRWPHFDDPVTAEHVATAKGNDRAWLRVQALYLETRELVLRPSLFLVLHSDIMLNAEESQAISEADPLENVLAKYLSTQLRSIASQHHSALVSRTLWCLETIREQVYLPEMGWLKCQTHFALGMLLVASAQSPSGSTESSLAETKHLVAQLVQSLELESVCSTEARKFAELLRRHFELLPAHGRSPLRPTAQQH
ncbi:hypothetical protein CC79DRAFT_1055464 [Sarocladium strictum]